MRIVVLWGVALAAGLAGFWLAGFPGMTLAVGVIAVVGSLRGFI